MTPDRLVQYRELTTRLDKEWLQVLRHGEIGAVDRTWVWGVSEKYVAEVAGHKAMIKPVVARRWDSMLLPIFTRLRRLRYLMPESPAALEPESIHDACVISLV